MPYFLIFSSYFVLYRECLIHNCIYFFSMLFLERISYPQPFFGIRAFAFLRNQGLTQSMPTPRKHISYEITKLGKYLKELRKEQGLSIRSVAKSCSVAPSYLANIEAGHTYKTIGVETLVKLSKFYSIPVSSMLKEAGFIDSYESDLPELGLYLRAKYQLSPQAIRDMTMAKEIVDKKYEKEKEKMLGGRDNQKRTR